VTRPLDRSAFAIRQALGRTFKQFPVARSVVRGAMNAFYRVALVPFGRNRPEGTAGESAALVARTDELNRAAEQYFAGFGDTAFILGKPFSDESGFARHLFSLAVLVDGLRLRRRDVVVEFGAGTCWVSHFLNKFGCKTISVDVSRTALELGRRLFEGDPATRWDVGPEFRAYDGHRLPLDDASADRVIILDAFHHVPNQREILTELHRILRPDGIVAMSEPGRGHAQTCASQMEVSKHGVLENELVIEDVATLALACGFRAAHVIVGSIDALWEIPAREVGPFIQGQGFPRFWDNQSDALLAHHHLLLYKGDPRPTTRQPKATSARIELPDGHARLEAAAGRPVALTVTVQNTAETLWLCGQGDGWTRLGAHLYRGEDGAELVDFDWLRVSLPKDVSQYELVRVPVELPAIEHLGTFRIVFDVVVEGIMWLGDRGSPTTAMTLVIRS
jgi:SAM-dependent methyltransferase